MKGAVVFAEILLQLQIPPWKRKLRFAASVDDLPKYSFILGVVVMVTGILSYVGGTLAYVASAAETADAALLEQSKGNLTTEQAIGHNLSGMVSFWSFLFTPLGMFCVYLMADGLLRSVAALAASQATGTLLSYPFFLAFDSLRRRRAVSGRLADFGPEVPDEVEWRLCEGGFAPVIRASRDKEWTPVTTVRVGGAEFAVSRISDERKSGRLRVIYELSPWPADRIVRRLAEYDLPKGARAGTPASPAV